MIGYVDGGTRHAILEYNQDRTWLFLQCRGYGLSDSGWVRVTGVEVE